MFLSVFICLILGVGIVNIFYVVHATRVLGLRHKNVFDVFIIASERGKTKLFISKALSELFILWFQIIYKERLQIFFSKNSEFTLRFSQLHNNIPKRKNSLLKNNFNVHPPPTKLNIKSKCHTEETPKWEDKARLNHRNSVSTETKNIENQLSLEKLCH